MSGLEQRTKGRDETPAGTSAVTAVIARSPAAENAVGPQILPSPDWSAIESDLLDERRAAVPAFPLELLPQPWRDWASAAARSVDAPVDYAAQAMLASVAGVSGTGLWVCITRGWIEPLQLWLAVVGAPSTGKSPALGAVLRLLYGLEREAIDGLEAPPRNIVLHHQSVQAVAEAQERAQHGMLLLRDEAEGCFTPLKGMDNARQLETLEVSTLGSIEPDGVAPAVQRGGEALAARFLYAWPHPAPFRPLADRDPPEDDEVQALMRRLLQMAVPSRDPPLLLLEAPAAHAFNAFLERLHGEVRQAEGLEAAWLGKGRRAVACLAATFALMSWSSTSADDRLRSIGLESVERAVSLWSDYYRPHASAFLQRSAPTDVEGRVRRVVRWLRSDGRAIVSRRDVRRTALAQTVNASEADRVLARLVEAGVLQPLANEGPAQRGRPALRWQVNPLVATA